MTINSINKNQEALNTPLKYYYRDVIDGCWTEATKYKVFSNPDRPKTIRAVGEQHWQNIGTWK